MSVLTLQYNLCFTSVQHGKCSLEDYSRITHFLAKANIVFPASITHTCFINTAHIEKQAFILTLKNCKLPRIHECPRKLI